MSATHSWITRYPKIGIRPTIDGRYGGVRESLEDQVMNLAEAAIELIESNLYYPDGKPVQCVLADFLFPTYSANDFHKLSKLI